MACLSISFPFFFVVARGVRKFHGREPNMEPATPPAPAAGVTATVDLSPVAASLGGAHLLPCGIRQNGGAPVSDYFKPRATGPFPPTQIPRFLFPAHLVEELVWAS